MDYTLSTYVTIFSIGAVTFFIYVWRYEKIHNKINLFSSNLFQGILYSTGYVYVAKLVLQPHISLLVKLGNYHMDNKKKLNNYFLEIYYEIVDDVYLAFSNKIPLSAQTIRVVSEKIGSFTDFISEKYSKYGYWHASNAEKGQMLVTSLHRLMEDLPEDQTTLRKQLVSAYSMLLVMAKDKKSI